LRVYVVDDGVRRGTKLSGEWASLEEWIQTETKDDKRMKTLAKQPTMPEGSPSWANVRDDAYGWKTWRRLSKQKVS
jgi:hypothetical protein